MVIDFIMVTIERYDTPYNSDLHYTIKDIKKVEVASSVYTEIMPQINEIIRFKDKDFMVDKIIRILDSNNNTKKFVIEVKPYCTRKLMCVGSNNWYENIPLGVDIK